jgi:hypothetical protein
MWRFSVILLCSRTFGSGLCSYPSLHHSSKITSHVFLVLQDRGAHSPCQHIREYPNALKHRQEDVSSLAIKQYIPLDNLEPEAGAVTIIAGHANGSKGILVIP